MAWSVRPPSSDRPSSDRPLSDRPAPDGPASNHPAPDRPAPDRPAPDRPAADLDRRAAGFRRIDGSLARRRSGVGHLFWTLLVSSLLLVPNGALALTLLQWLRLFSEWFESPRIGQTLVFALPVALLFLEWWIFDRVGEWLSPEQPSKSVVRSPR